MRNVRTWSVVVLAAAALAAFVTAQDKPKGAGGQEKEMVPPQRPDPDARLEQFRKLAGQWQGKGEGLDRGARIPAGRMH